MPSLSPWIPGWTFAAAAGCLALVAPPAATSQQPRVSIGGVHPHLAMWNHEGECGTGAVVPWAGSLWVITYSPHKPKGSDDKLYRISPALDVEVFQGSVGGTPASRMIHEESQQLFIGPYAIDRDGNVRTIDRSLVGRLTGAARHLHDPAGKIYLATMEEGIYEVDVETLAFTELFADDQGQIHSDRAGDGTTRRLMAMPGYHGKGLYSGQGRLIYANNGEPGAAAKQRPDVPSGVLAEWTGGDDHGFRVVRRAQFTDVRGPGNLRGNADPRSDPVWAIGWDHRSLLLMLLDGGEWSTFRLPKASHTYDGAHGWNTEWPRFQDLGQELGFVFDMHGAFWSLPRTFSRKDTSGIAPRSTYLKVVGDYTMWRGKLVLGCDDTASKEFLNKRRAKGDLRGPGQSHSNLWFLDPGDLDRLGAPLGRGAVWTLDDVRAGEPSDPYLLGPGTGARSFRHRSLWVTHAEGQERTFRIEVDQAGDGAWSRWTEVVVAAGDAVWREIPADLDAAWIRIVPNADTAAATAVFHYRAEDTRPAGGDADTRSPLFAGLATPDAPAVSRGRLLVRGDDRKTLAFAVDDTSTGTGALYELDGALRLEPSSTPDALDAVRRFTKVPQDVLTGDAASMLYIDDDGNRWRLPRASRSFPEARGIRIDREVVTERDLFQCAGIFYELPARNAGGFAKIRPITTHGLVIHDYASYRGLLVLSGISASADAAPDNDRIIRSDDGKAALWVGVIDELWQAGKATGIGGPWLDTEVRASVRSDPYLMSGFDRKTIRLAHDDRERTRFTIEVDISGDGLWVEFDTIDVDPGQTHESELPASLGAYWVRVACDRDTTATAQLRYW